MVLLFYFKFYYFERLVLEFPLPFRIVWGDKDTGDTLPEFQLWIGLILPPLKESLFWYSYIYLLKAIATNAIDISFLLFKSENSKLCITSFE